MSCGAVHPCASALTVIPESCSANAAGLVALQCNSWHFVYIIAAISFLFFRFVRSVCPTHASSCALARCLFNEHQMQNVCRRARTRELKKEKKTITVERIFSWKNPLEQNIEMGVCVCVR